MSDEFSGMAHLLSPGIMSILNYFLKVAVFSRGNNVAHISNVFASVATNIMSLSLLGNWLYTREFI